MSATASMPYEDWVEYCFTYARDDWANDTVQSNPDRLALAESLPPLTISEYLVRLMENSSGLEKRFTPEQIGKAKTVDHRADIYACATLIYQSLTGQLPYSARNILVMFAMKSKTDARKLGDAMSGPVDPRVEAFVARGLSRDPSQRFQNALEALDAWRDLRPAGPSSAPEGQAGGVRVPLVGVPGPLGMARAMSAAIWARCTPWSGP